METIEFEINQALETFDDAIENITVVSQDFIIKYDNYIARKDGDFSQEYIRSLVVDKINEVVNDKY